MENKFTQEDIKAAEEYASEIEIFRDGKCCKNAFLAGILHERGKKTDYFEKYQYEAGLNQVLLNDNKKIIDKLNEAFLPQNIECDGSHCTGCWKDVVREAIKML